MMTENKRIKFHPEKEVAMKDLMMKSLSICYCIESMAEVCPINALLESKAEKLKTEIEELLAGGYGR